MNLLIIIAPSMILYRMVVLFYWKTNFNFANAYGGWRFRGQPGRLFYMPCLGYGAYCCGRVYVIKNYFWYPYRLGNKPGEVIVGTGRVTSGGNCHATSVLTHTGVLLGLPRGLLYISSGLLAVFRFSLSRFCGLLGSTPLCTKARFDCRESCCFGFF